MTKKSEYKAFESLLGRVANVPHDRIKAELDAEKKAKKKPAKKRASRASDPDVSEKD